MSLKKKALSTTNKSSLHPRNQHHQRYDLAKLEIACPELSPYIIKTKMDQASIDFSDQAAIKALNKAILMHHYKLQFWELPEGYLCPPVPGRADYIHHIADLMGSTEKGKIPKGQHIKILDLGCGASLIYPIIGVAEYGWSVIGTDIDPVAIESARKIVKENRILKGKIELRLQPDPKNIFTGIFDADEIVDISICNPPFHTSIEEAEKANIRKNKNLGLRKKSHLNFGGQWHELITEGGEKKFVSEMIRQSMFYANNCHWFTTLISKKANLDFIYGEIEQSGAYDMKTITIGHGNKTSRIVAWTFLNDRKREKWRKLRWESR